MEIPKISGRQTSPPRTSAGLVPRGELDEPTRIMAELDCAGASAGNKPNGEVDGESEFSGLDGQKRTQPTPKHRGRRRGLGVRNETLTDERRSERAGSDPGGSPPAPGRTRAAGARTEREDGGGAGGSGWGSSGPWPAAC